MKTHKVNLVNNLNEIDVGLVVLLSDHGQIVDTLKLEVETLMTQAENLFSALNNAHVYVDKRTHPRVDAVCRKALTSWEKFRDERALK